MNDPSKPRRRGCWLYGCLITLALALIGVIAGFLILRHVVHQTVMSYTDTTPAKLPDLVITQPEIEAAQQRWKTFFEGLKGNQPLPPLTLTADDLNALIASTGTNALRDKLRVTIENNQLKGQVSFPLDRLQNGMLQGRYLNGTILFKVGLQDGVLTVRAESIEVKDQPLPGWLMSRIRAQNWAQNLMNDMNAVAVLQNLESIVVTNDALVVTPKNP